ncbi:uncharacterized protein K02A2.6-like [Topomyia yanbarensis]|uniref:uncharacterized protein K02A2.6-like n=1 Tax=Topomyia yanbarensis TaxID=2498891 RepID=UPI00273CDBF4|nr:uncharacterized protein K02A2.6-like [Topomyia yanbarensis]
MDKWNLQPFCFKSLLTSQVRDEWFKYKRNFQYIALANEEKDQTKLKYIFLAKSGPEVQEVFSSLPGADVEEDSVTGVKPFEVAIKKLDEYFAPRHHETFERHIFWTLKPNTDESLKKFLLRATEQATKCNFGNTKDESVEISVIDKVILLAPSDLKAKLLQKVNLNLTELTKVVNSYSSVKFQARQMNAEPQMSANVNKLQMSSKPTSTECSRCGWKGHFANDRICPAKNKICDKCGRVGHFAKRCKASLGGLKRHNLKPIVDSKRRRINAIELERNQEEQHTSFIYNIGDHDELLWVRIGGVLTQMMIDSGSFKNIIDEQTFRSLTVQGLKIKNDRNDCELIFRPYGKNSSPLKVVKVFEAIICVDDAGKQLEEEATFFVVAEGSQSILGRETAIALGVLIIGLPSTHLTVRTIKDERPFPKVKGVKLCIPIDKTVPSVAQHARRPPLALLHRIEEKLNMLLTADIIEPVHEYSQWVPPLVAIVKDNGDLRLCVDMRRANEAIQRENHLMPTFDDFPPRLKKVKYFSRLDVKEAFHQIELEESCRNITTFITHKGVFRYKRLMFGISCAPEMFQKILEQILAECENVINYIDDILIFGETEQEHDDSLAKVLNTLKLRGVLLNQSKCVYKVTQVTFLGHHLSADGIRPAEEKTEVLKSFRAPTNVEELRSFLGLVTYVGRFLHDLGTVTDPLRELTKKGVHFDWNVKHDAAFERIKSMICKIGSLQYFDNTLRTRLPMRCRSH